MGRVHAIVSGIGELGEATIGSTIAAKMQQEEKNREGTSMATPESIPQIRLFYSYAHKDEEFLDGLRKHLAPLTRQDVVQEWYDREIGAGHEWEKAIKENLEAADVILLLVSADFLASYYCYEKEMQRALEKHEAGEVRVIPVILRDVVWSGAPFGKLQVLPRDARPVANEPNQDKAWANVAQEIRREIEKLRAGIKPKIALLEQIKPAVFNEKELLVEDMKESAKQLYRMVERSHFRPDIIIGINGGGMVVAAAMNATSRRPIGVIDTRDTEATYISLPYAIESVESHDRKKVEPYSKRILVTDTKLKSGGALQKAQTILQNEYGKDARIRYAIALGYGGWDLSRWKVIHETGFHWPVQFWPKNLPVYVARYTETDPNNDNIVEELHPGWEKL